MSQNWLARRVSARGGTVYYLGSFQRGHQKWRPSKKSRAKRRATMERFRADGWEVSFMQLPRYEFPYCLGSHSKDI